jgi:hypothetical protein
MSASGQETDILRTSTKVRFTPQKQTFVGATGMSALHQKQTFCTAEQNAVIRSSRRRAIGVTSDLP